MRVGCNNLLLGTAVLLSGIVVDAFAPSMSPSPRPSSESLPYSFQTFQFAPNGVCVQPSCFVDQETSNEFTMRNVPGDGDCMFLAVALAAATSMGLGGNDALLRAISRETREVVAQVLESPGNLHIAKERIVAAKDLLHSAAREEGLTPEEYLNGLRKEGSQGGLYGGGPELTVLANVLRRPISVYEIDPSTSTTSTNGEDAAENEEGVVVPGSSCRIVCQGIFGDGVFSDPCATIPDSAILSGVQPGAYSWQLHILVLDVSPEEKHACVLLPQKPI